MASAISAMSSAEKSAPCVATRPASASGTPASVSFATRSRQVWSRTRRGSPAAPPRRLWAVAGALPEILVESELQTWRERVAKLTEVGVPETLAGRVATQGALFSALDIAEIALATEHPVKEVTALHFEIGGNLSLHWLRDRIALLPRDNRWQAMARAALRDDLFSLHAELTTAVLRSRRSRRLARGPSGTPPTAPWRSSRRSARAARST